MTRRNSMFPHGNTILNPSAYANLTSRNQKTWLRHLPDGKGPTEGPQLGGAT
jgi:hypothetical protein